MTLSVSGDWSAIEASEFLGNCVFPLRLAMTDHDGYPRVVSLWYLWRGDVLCCATNKKARVLEWLTRNPKCGFELAPNEPPYHGLRGTGQASIDPLGADDLLERLIDRYLGNHKSPLADWLLARKNDECIIKIAPKTISSWDYRLRMSA